MEHEPLPLEPGEVIRTHVVSPDPTIPTVWDDLRALRHARSVAKWLSALERLVVIE